jgi:hypothetical protein
MPAESQRGEPPSTMRQRASASSAQGHRQLRRQATPDGHVMAAHGIDLVSITDTMGRSALATTGRYLHAHPASDQAAAFTRALELAPAAEQPVGPA